MGPVAMTSRSLSLSRSQVANMMMRILCLILCLLGSSGCFGARAKRIHEAHPIVITKIFFPNEAAPPGEWKAVTDDREIAEWIDAHAEGWKTCYDTIAGPSTVLHGPFCDLYIYQTSMAGQIGRNRSIVRGLSETECAEVMRIIDSAVAE
jgi:hypothetical protein